MRRLRLSAPAQPPLPSLEGTAEQVWVGLPEEVQTVVLAVLARLIAKGVVDEEEM